MSTKRSSRPPRGLAAIGPRQRISGPGELIAAVPYLLGFHPLRSLVLVGLDGGVLIVTARLDLVDAVQPGLVQDTVAAMMRGGAGDVVAVVFEPGPDDRPADVVDVVATAAVAAHCDVADVLLVSDERWWSLACADPRCCPPEGNSLGRTTPFAAAATFAGVAPVPDRDALIASLAPYATAASEPIAALIAAAENAHLDSTLAGGGRRRHERAAARAILRHARESSVLPWAGVDDEVAAEYGVALSSRLVRDPVWMAVDARRVDGRELWRDVARRLPDPYAAAPLWLFGWASWRAGDGALASIAAERAVDSDPDCVAAQLLRAAVASGVDPFRVPPLQVPTSA